MKNMSISHVDRMSTVSCNVYFFVDHRINFESIRLKNEKFIAYT